MNHRAAPISLATIAGFAVLLGSSAAALADESSPELTSISETFVRISSGTFQMGSPLSQPRFPTEVLHQVTISRDFEIQATPVTQLQWFNVMGNNPSFFKSSAVCGAAFRRVSGVPLCPNHPVENITWVEVQEFLEQLNAASGLDCSTFERARDTPGCYRLPTESEWEYAARAGTTTAYWFGSSVRSLATFAWYLDNSGGRTHGVGNKPPNPWGLYDMTGNVWQWVQDFFGAYPTSPVTDPLGPRTGSWRSFRGCGWNTAPDGTCPQPCRTAYRNFEDFGPRGSDRGFRLVRTVR